MYVCMAGVIKKVGSGCFKLVHEKYRAKNADDEADQYQRKFQEAPDSPGRGTYMCMYVCLYVCMKCLSLCMYEVHTPA